MQTFDKNDGLLDDKLIHVEAVKMGHPICRSLAGNAKLAGRAA
jgi:hypothetical protein